MVSRYRSLALYSLAIAAAAVAWLYLDLRDAPDFPAAWIALAWIVVILAIWHFGIPVPRVGLTSMERVPQIGLLLVFSPPVAAVLCGSAAFLWPLLSRSYSHGSPRAAILRAVHNGAMDSLMLLVAGYAYLAVGGIHPIGVPGLVDIVPLLVMALAAQAVNVVLLATYFRLDGRDVGRIIKPVYSLVDLVFVPAGVLAAVLHNTAAPATFALFALLMIVFVLSFNGIGSALAAADADSSPLSRLSRAWRALRGARRLDELGDRILGEARALFRFDEFHLVLADQERRVLEMRVHERLGERLPVHTRPIDAGLFGRVLAQGGALLVEDGVAEHTSGSLIVVALQEGGRSIGLLAVRHARPGSYSDADLHLMQSLAEQVAPAIVDARAFEELENYRRHLEQRVAERTDELARANRDKERLIAALDERSRAFERESQEDSLTGIANRRAFNRRVATEVEVSRATGRPLALAVADLDHFKLVNDELGHAIGDLVLRECAAVMRGLCRQADFAARIGGEEFAMIFPGLSQPQAAQFCERLRHAIEHHDWRSLHPRLQVTVSIGVTQWDCEVGADELLRAADTRLYDAKRAGRNRVA
ncbi:MAG TPA: sensor domain-containing diguanylate cyclase [Steroidobacteraceae bacterium]|nr:sensor domain-containing diguanylate cyclase [Steroidobacteraceae bacterium]HQX47718.1 sensor domain-containing diguanylate cyclase [Steroidobacteraceae bacterium]HQX79344.1 sensor domain-containing diguanylate cyclase [Steroidobacteraceae bacterium]HQZ80941.1 sensor domain-containing diguanylate cyclase [Steroidobacteraceae bacterium]